MGQVELPDAPLGLLMMSATFCSSVLHLRAYDRHLLGPEVAFDMRRSFAHSNQQADVRFIIACLHMIEAEHDNGW